MLADPKKSVRDVGGKLEYYEAEEVVEVTNQKKVAVAERLTPEAVPTEVAAAHQVAEESRLIPHQMVARAAAVCLSPERRPRSTLLKS